MTSPVSSALSLKRQDSTPLPKGARRLDSVSIATIRTFVSAVETGAFSAASRHLGVAVSTVSKHVDVLEHRLKTTLFTRSTRRLNLTDSGALLYEHCKVILDSVDAAVDQSFNSKEIRGRVRVVAPPSLSHCILSPALPAFLSRHPGLSLELKVTTASVDLLKDRVDVAIEMTAESTGSGKTERIGSAPSVLCASPEYLARHGVPEEPSHLVHHRCMAGINSPFSERWCFKLGPNTIELPITSVFTSDTGAVLRDACLSGLGIAGFYMFHIKADLAEGRLVRVLEKYEVGDGAIYTSTPNARFLPRATSEFLKFFKDLCKAL